MSPSDNIMLGSGFVIVSSVLRCAIPMMTQWPRSLMPDALMLKPHMGEVDVMV